jgi:hypothetical protein
MIVPTASLHLFGRQAMLTSVGTAALASVQPAAERGEIREADTHKLTADLQHKAADRAKAANEARVEKTEQVPLALWEHANKLLRRRGPEMKVGFPDQPEAVPEAVSWSL